MCHFVGNSQVQSGAAPQTLSKHWDTQIYKGGGINPPRMQLHNHSNSPAPSDSKNMPVLSMDASRADLLKVTDSCPLCGVWLISCDCVSILPKPNWIVSVTSLQISPMARTTTPAISPNVRISSMMRTTIPAISPNIRISLMTRTTTPAISPNVTKLDAVCQRWLRWQVRFICILQELAVRQHQSSICHYVVVHTQLKIHWFDVLFGVRPKDYAQQDSGSKS